MSKGNTAEQDYLDFVFLNVAMPAYGSNLVANLHKADPGEGGTAATNVADYTSYASVNISRDASGWSRSASTTSNVALVQFPACSGVADDQTITHLSISGANGFFISGALSQGLRVTNLVQPQFAIGFINYTED